MVAVIGSAFISLSETAVLAVNKIRIRHLAEGGDRRASKILGLSKEPEKFFGAILLASNIFTMLVGAVATSLAIRVWGNTGGVVAGATIAATAVVVLLGDLTPKSIAAVASERVALFVARPVYFLTRVSAPVVWVFTLLPRALTTLIGARDGLAGPPVTDSELRMLIGVGEAEGTVEHAQGAMLEKVFRFGETEVRAVMTPRTEIAWVRADTTLGEFLAGYHERPFNRFPVYEDDYDDVVGVLSVKDVFVAQATGTLDPSQPVTRMSREPLFAPETKQLDDLLAAMQQSGHRMAIVVDEYGGVAGLVTLTHVLEQIVGRTSDEGRRSEQGFVRVDENTFVLDGGMTVPEANDALGLSLPDGDYKTVAGFILDQLQRVPAQGDRVRYGGLRLQITEMDGNRVAKVSVRRQEQPSAAEAPPAP